MPESADQGAPVGGAADHPAGSDRLPGATPGRADRPWAASGRAVAIDSTVLHTRGDVWDKKHRDAEVVPHTSIDTEAGWTKSGWHGRIHGWKLHLATTVAAVWIPLAADLTPANSADNEPAPRLLDELPIDERFVLGDADDNGPAVRDHCTVAERFLVATRRGPYPHTDDGIEVRRVSHKLRSLAIENSNS